MYGRRKEGRESSARETIARDVQSAATAHHGWLFIQDQDKRLPCLFWMLTLDEETTVVGSPDLGLSGPARGGTSKCSYIIE